jgi:hypothetical protein
MSSVLPTSALGSALHRVNRAEVLRLALARCAVGRERLRVSPSSVLVEAPDLESQVVLFSTSARDRRARS